MCRANAFLRLLPLSTFIILATSLKVSVANDYSWQIVALLGDTEIETQAADFLYDKNPGVSTLVSWNENENMFVYKKGKLLDTSDLDYRYVGIQVVGHGNGSDQTLSRKSFAQVSSAVAGLYHISYRALNETWSDMTGVAQVCVVCCNCYEGSHYSFALNLIYDLRKNHIITTSVTVRNFLISIDSTGEKLTCVMNTGDKMVWEPSDLDVNITHFYTTYTNDFGQFSIYSESSHFDGHPITCKVCGIKSHGHILQDDSENGVTLSVRAHGDKNPTALVRFTQKALYDIIIDVITSEIFENAWKNEDGLWDRTTQEKRFVVREGINVAYSVEDSWVYGYKDSERNVRIINSLQDLVNEINYFGRKGVDPEQEAEFIYYKFGDFIISMDTTSFYAWSTTHPDWYGNTLLFTRHVAVILAEIPQDAPIPLPEDKMNELIAQSPYNWLQQDHLINIAGWNYAQLLEVDDDFFHDLKAFMTGKNSEIEPPDFNKKESIIAKANSARRAVSMALSESIRNFRTHVTNMIALDLNEHYLLNHLEFFDSHPMTHDWTWVKPFDTGYKGCYGDYSWDQIDTLSDRQKNRVLTVRQRMANFAGEWLSKLDDEKIEVESNQGVVYLERSNPSMRKSGINVTVIDDALNNDLTEVVVAVYTAVLETVQDVHNNATTKIFNNPNFDGFLASIGEITTSEIEAVHNLIEDIDSRTSTEVALQTLQGFTYYHPFVPIFNLAGHSKVGQSLKLTSEQNYYPAIQSLYGSLIGPNHMVGNEQHNTLVGGNKQDALFGEDGNDILKGEGDADFLYGGSGNDILDGGNGNDQLYGDEGDDILIPGNGDDIVHGGDGIDIVVCTGTPVTGSGSYYSYINLEERMSTCDMNSFATLVSIEGAYGSEYDNTIIDSPGDDVLLGNVGSDKIVASKGFDYIRGGPGSDTYDLTDATGIKIIENYADDLKKDVIVMSYANKSSIRYSRLNNNYDLIVRVTFPDYPEDFYDATKPTVIIYNWFLGDEYKHIEFNVGDGVVSEDLIKACASVLVGFTLQDIFGEE